MSESDQFTGAMYQDLMYVISCSIGEKNADLSIVLSGIDLAQRVAHVTKLFNAGLNEPITHRNFSRFEVDLERYTTYVLSAIRDSHLLPHADKQAEDTLTPQWLTRYKVPVEKATKLKWDAATETADLEIASRAKEMYESLPEYKDGPILEKTRKYLLGQLCHYWIHGCDDVKARTYFTHMVEIYISSKHEKYREWIVKVIEEANRNSAKPGRYEMALEHLQPIKKHEPLMRVLAQGLTQNLPLSELRKRLMSTKPT